MGPICARSRRGSRVSPHLQPPSSFCASYHNLSSGTKRIFFLCTVGTSRMIASFHNFASSSHEHIELECKGDWFDRLVLSSIAFLTRLLIHRCDSTIRMTASNLFVLRIPLRHYYPRPISSFASETTFSLTSLLPLEPQIRHNNPRRHRSCRRTDFEEIVQCEGGCGWTTDRKSFLPDLVCVHIAESSSLFSFSLSILPLFPLAPFMPTTL